MEEGDTEGVARTAGEVIARRGVPVQVVSFNLDDKMDQCQTNIVTDKSRCIEKWIGLALFSKQSSDRA